MEALSLRDATAEEREQQYRHQAEGVQSPPTEREVVHLGVEQGAESVAHGGERPQHADSPTPVRRWELLGHDDEGRGRSRDDEGPAQHLADDELLGGLRKGGQEGPDAEARHGDQKQAPAAQAICQRNHKEGGQGAEADGAGEQALRRLAQPEVARNSAQRRGEQRHVVALEEQSQGHDAEHGQVTFFDTSRYTPEKRRDPPGVAERAGRRFGHLGGCTIHQHRDCASMAGPPGRWADEGVA